MSSMFQPGVLLRGGCCLIVGSCCCALQTGGAEPALPTADSLAPRAIVSEGDLARLRQVVAKARRGDKVVLGVIGGSITQGAAASKPEKRYANVILAGWKTAFPNATFELVNAGIGATGSNYGAMRVQRDLLSRHPDFVVVEYAVNDGNTRELAESYEGLVRQILNAPNHPAVVLLFMMNKSGGNAQEWQSKIGTHYSLPMVSYRDALWPEIEAKRMTWEQISPDLVHPNDVGHEYAARFVLAWLEKAVGNMAVDAAPAAGVPLPAPLLTGQYEFTALAEANQLKPAANRGWEYDEAHKRDCCWKSSTPGSVIEFDVDGERLFLTYWRIRGAMGKARVTVDAGEPVTLDAWFDQTWGGYRQMLEIGKDLKPGAHRVRVELLAEKHAESTGTEFRVLCLGAAGVPPTAPAPAPAP